MPTANPATIGDLNHRSICQIARTEQGISICLKMQHNLVFIPTEHKIFRSVTLRVLTNAFLKSLQLNSCSKPPQRGTCKLAGNHHCKHERP